jgi:hypothetical protein
MLSSQSDSTLPSVGSLKRKPGIAAAVILLGIVLAGLIFYFNSNRSPVNSEIPRKLAYSAQLVSRKGAVLLFRTDRAGWREIDTGTRLGEGDLVQTESSGNADIRYNDGTMVIIPENTNYSVSSARNSVEISVPQFSINKGSFLIATAGSTSKPADGSPQQDNAPPYIKLERIIPFGRTLELVGRVEAGSRLVVNDEIVEVAGDGLFKHFTNPFPPSIPKVVIVMKATDLAGRTRYLTATHDFRLGSGDN